MATTCPGAENSRACDNHACRLHGCQGGGQKHNPATVKLDHGADEAARHGVARSSHWPSVERAFRAAHPHCAACEPSAAKHSVSVHHRWPFHIVTVLGRADLELDPRNLISLCETTHLLKAENHHELLGHLGDFKSYNVDVLKDASITFRGMSNEEIRADKRWQVKVRARPLDELTDSDKDEIRRLIEAELPLRALAA